MVPLAGRHHGRDCAPPVGTPDPDLPGRLAARRRRRSDQPGMFDEIRRAVSVAVRLAVAAPDLIEVAIDDAYADQRLRTAEVVDATETLEARAEEGDGSETGFYLTGVPESAEPPVTSGQHSRLACPRVAAAPRRPRHRARPRDRARSAAAFEHQAAGRDPHSARRGDGDSGGPCSRGAARVAVRGPRRARARPRRRNASSHCLRTRVPGAPGLASPRRRLAPRRYRRPRESRPV